jgi:hypothetical protein
MSRDLRKLAGENKQHSQQSNKNVYLELNKSPFTAVSQPNPLLQPNNNTTNLFSQSATAKLVSALQNGEISSVPTPALNDVQKSAKSSRGRGNNTLHAVHPTQSMGLGSFNIQERPASRLEINSLEG